MTPILLVNFGFPPNDGIGGRRWAKLSKFLAKKGYEVHVIMAEKYTAKDSPWTKDVNHSNIKIAQLPLNYPNVFNEVHGVVDKIKAKFLRTWYSLVQDKRIYDKAFLWEEQYLKAATELIQKHQIKNVIVTGAPFYLFYYTTKLFKQFPDLHFIADYRDPWLGAANYGMEVLSPEKFQKEVEYQNEVAKYASYITAPNDFMLADIKKEVTVASNVKYVAIPHSYDEQDISGYSTFNIQHSKITFVYGGALYTGIEKTLKSLKLFLDELKNNNRSLYDKVLFKIYAPETHFKSWFTEHKEAVSIQAPIGNNIFNELQNAHFTLLFLAEHNKNYQTTKFFEYMGFRKPFVLLGVKGYVSEFLEKNKLGVCFSDQELNKLSELISDPDRVYASFNSTYDVSQHSLDRVGEGLIKLLKQ